MTDKNTEHSRLLDVHRHSNYPEVNEFVDAFWKAHIYAPIFEPKYHPRFKKAPVKTEAIQRSADLKLESVTATPSCVNGGGRQCSCPALCNQLRLTAFLLNHRASDPAPSPCPQAYPQPWLRNQNRDYQSPG